MPDRSRIRLRTLAAVPIAAATWLAAASPAAAYLRDFQSVVGGTASSSSTIKSAQISCPAGKLGIGTGARVAPPLANVGLDRAWMSFEQQQSLVGGTETDASLPGWRVSGTALCATQTAAVPPPGGIGYLKNRSLVTASSASDSRFSHQAVATCPAGWTAIGGGGQVVGQTPTHAPPNDVALDTSQRSGPLGTGWRARAHEVDLTPARWKVRAFAICSNVNGALTTAIYIGPNEDAIQAPVTQPGPPRSGVQSWVAPCPSGTKVIGGGGMVLGATDTSPPPADVVLGASHPEDAPTATGWSVQTHDTDPPGPAYRVAIRAICG
jgi:hypothetical protein